MKATVLSAAVLLCLASAVQAHFGRNLLARCNPQTQLQCGNKCVNFKTDRKHCGSCTPCPPTFICKDAGCVCPKTSPDLCTDRCINMKSDAMNCGTCGNICPSGLCKLGACVGGDDGCGPYQRLCGSKCLNVMTDMANCGTCGVKCTGGTVCVGGGCICPPTKPNMCSYICLNKQTNVKNCEFCGNDCTKGGKLPNAKCIMGKCIA